jgi:Fe-S-cluster containining protein
MAATTDKIAELVHQAAAEKVQRRLQKVYNQIPETSCQRCADCCFAAAQVYEVEFLNILNYLQRLPELTKRKVLKNIFAYELLNLVTLDYKCPFLENKNCLIYEVRPAQCRLFGLYPDEEYKKLKEESLQANERVAIYYARYHRLLLPKEVMTYDIDQCQNNVDASGQRVIVGAAAREHIFEQICQLEHDIVQGSNYELNRFTYLFVSLFMSDKELEETKLNLMKQWLAGAKKSFERFWATKNFNF